MAAALDNANPIVVSASQLPKRQARSTPRSGPDSKYDQVVFSKPPRPISPGPKSDFPASWHYPNIGEVEVAADPIDEQEVYDIVSTISDPEHPLSLGQLSVINLNDIHIKPRPALGVPDPNAIVEVLVEITPTITHCSMATIIGLGVRVRLEQTLPPNYRVDVRCKENSHYQDDQVNKQLSDKERVAAALENDNLRGVLDKMFETGV